MTYSIEELVKKFSEHSEVAKKKNKELIAKFREYNPGEKLPKHFKNDFSLPDAMVAICEEILKLKEKSQNEN